MIKVTITSGIDGGWGWKIEFNNNPPVCGFDDTLRLVRLHIDPFGVVKKWATTFDEQDFTVTIIGTV